MHHHIAIIGTGFSGLGMAIRLKREGIDDFVLLERADDVGGTWRDNSYPGCQCDIPSHLYSLSFAPNPDWSRTYSMQPEIWEYLQRLAERHGLMPHIRLGHEVTAAEWDEDAARWRIDTAAGPLSADVLVNSGGGLADPRVPELPGLDSFQGRWFHSAEWDHEHSIIGGRVAVIGTGASAIQIVPQIQPIVGRLAVFQRTPPWVVPHRDRAITRLERRIYRRFPLLQRVPRYLTYWARELLVLGLVYRPGALKLLERAARRHMEQSIDDPGLRDRVTPDYRFGCKRILPSNGWYPALGKDNVELVTSGIAAIEPTGIRDRAGVLHEVDTIVFATGFHTTDLPIANRIRGRGARTLAESWSGGMEAYLGTSVAGYPNFFTIPGPNVGLGHNSVVVMFEGQINHAIGAIREMRARGAATVEVRGDVQEAHNRAIQSKLAGTVWNTGGCSSWYLDKGGRNTVIWPGFTWRYRMKTARFDASKYVLGPTLPAERAAPTPATTR